MLLLSLWRLIFCLAIFTGVLAVSADYIDKKYPPKPVTLEQLLSFAHIEISVERPIEMEIERPWPSPAGPDIV